MEPSRIRIYKSLLRNKLRHTVRQIPLPDRLRKSRKAIKNLMRHPYFLKARHVLTYMPLAYELDTRELIRRGLQTEKIFYLPRVDQKTRQLAIVRIRHPKRNLRRGHYGILEPHSGSPVSPSILDLVVLPGLGFDKRGARLGMGAGYFDRFLKKAPRAKRLGMAFRNQVLSHIPTEGHDIPMQGIITD